jgi:hypothetical protein
MAGLPRTKGSKFRFKLGVLGEVLGKLLSLLLLVILV